MRVMPICVFWLHDASAGARPARPILVDEFDAGSFESLPNNMAAAERQIYCSIGIGLIASSSFPLTPS
jgi:hypothetical protein